MFNLVKLYKYGWVNGYGRDNGFNYFIVLSGVIENLRKQTANRLYNDLKYSKVKTLIQWNRIDNPTTRSNDAKFSISNFNLRNDSKRKIFYCLFKTKED